jgi:hypothetical protein
VVGKAAVDEVEAAVEPTRQSTDVGLEERAVVEPALSRSRVRHLNHSRGEVNSDRLAPRKEPCDAPELAAGATPSIQNARIGRQIATDHTERLVKDRCRERSDENLVELGQRVELLHQVTMLARLSEKDGFPAVLGEAPAQTSSRQSHGLLADRAAYNPDSAPPQRSGWIEHTRGVPPERPNQRALGKLPRPQSAQHRHDTMMTSRRWMALCFALRACRIAAAATR